MRGSYSSSDFTILKFSLSLSLVRGAILVSLKHKRLKLSFSPHRGVILKDENGFAKKSEFVPHEGVILQLFDLN